MHVIAILTSTGGDTQRYILVYFFPVGSRSITRANPCMTDPISSQRLSTLTKS